MQRQQANLRPETALQQAEELIAVGQQSAALESLHEHIVSKRYRNYHLGLEAIMMKYVELCVQLGKESMFREGLAQYKNTCQHVNGHSFENIVTTFLNMAEAKVAAAQATAKKVAVEQIEDLEQSETPESLLMRALTEESASSVARTENEVVKPALRFLWEAFRTVLDILRNNNKLEVLYKTSMIRAQEFCLKYSRKVEFRRLCEISRAHLNTVLRYSQMPNAVSLNDPESLQLQLDTRFSQLNVASELELWQDAFRSIEDIHGLFRIAKKPGSPATMLNYYQKLVKMFWVSGNHVFHAAALGRYFHYLKMNENKDMIEFAKLAKQYVIAVLSIPIISKKSSFISELIDEHENKSKDQHLASLLGLSVIPTRETLLQNILEKDVQGVLDQRTAELYNYLEIQFHPLSISAKIEPLLAVVAKDDSTSQYLNSLYELFLVRYIQQISQVHLSMPFTEFVDKTTLKSVPTWSRYRFEVFILNGCKNNAFNIKIDCKKSELLFMDHKADNILSGKIILKTRIPLSSHVDSNFAMLCSEFPVDPLPENLYSSMKSLIDDENKKLLDRKKLIDKRKELLENEIFKREQEESRERALRLAYEQEAEKIRLQEETRRRELERIKKERDEIEKEEAKKMAEELKKRLDAVGMNIDMGSLEGLDKKTLLAKQIEHLDKEKKDMETRMKKVLKTMDHLDRAIRQEEKPLLESDFNEAKKQFEQKLLMKFNSDLELKRQLFGHVDDFKSFKESVMIKRTQQFQGVKSEAAAKLAEAKQERIKQHIAKAEEQARIKKGQEEARLRQQQEEDRLKAERAQQAELDKMRIEKLDEVARKQREAERRAEERIKTTTSTASDAGKYVAPRRAAEQPSASASAASSGKYIPPSRRGQNNNATESSSSDRWR